MKGKDLNRESILALLQSKSLLKQDIHQSVIDVFKQFKKIVEEEINQIKINITDPRVRCVYIDKGEFEIQVFIGSDVLVFIMHSNVFRFPDESPIWKIPYLKKDTSRGYTGMINVYNFLAASFEQNRIDDAGYLIGRLFINKENHFIVEGKGQLGLLFRDFGKVKLTDAVIKHVVQCSFAYALEFDLLTPPYEMMSQVSVGQMTAISSGLHIQTGKRLGFQFKVEDADFS